MVAGCFRHFSLFQHQRPADAERREESELETALADAEARLEKEVMFRSTTPLQDRKKQTTVSRDIRLLMCSGYGYG